MHDDMTKTKELAERIIRLSQKRIVEDAPHLLMAAYALQPCEKEEKGKISTDGKRFYYHPAQVMQDFQKNQDAVAEQILHVILHCLLGHLKERRFYTDEKLFDVLADCKVANFANCICRHIGQNWLWSVPSWMNEDKSLSKLYQQLSDSKINKNFLVKEDVKNLKMDDHRLWQKESIFLQKETAEGEDGEEVLELPIWGEIREALFGKAQKTGRWGSQVGAELFDGEMAEENAISYETFLKRFAVNRELMREDPDSIDFKWYHLGMENYGNIPLLEPTECNELPVNDQIIIAIDTSGSCSGEVCSRFLRETLHLLRDISAGRKDMDVTLLQCDTCIQQEKRVTSTDHLEKIIEEFQPKGFGGTDFRPVFQWIAEYCQKGGRVNALLYLSDGEGDFPERKPDYPVAFFLYDAWDTSHIPAWVTQLQLNTNDFTVKEARG